MPKLISQKNFKNVETSYEETSSTAEQVIDTFSKNRFRSVKYQVQVTNNTSYHTTEILLVHDGTLQRAGVSLQLLTIGLIIFFALPRGRKRSQISEVELAR